MRPLQRCLRLSVRILTPLVVVSWVGIACAADRGGGELVAPSTRLGVEFAQQAKPAPSAPAKAAPAGAAPAEEVAAWAVNCTDQGQPRFTCEMTQSLIDQKTNTQIMLLSIKSVASGESKALLVRAFHGVYLPTGVSVKVDGGQSTRSPSRRAIGSGAYAALPLTDALVADMKRGKDLKFSLEINKGEPLDLIARLTGFGPAYERVSSVK